MREEPTLQDYARKLLSFTDNRQDASLQAGHFNDFVEVSLLRSALYKAVAAAGAEGLAHDELTQKVYKALSLPFELFAREPGVRFAQRTDTERAFRNVLGYRLYRDQKRGWRVTSPNLEQCGLLRIEYPSLDQLCEDEAFWNGCQSCVNYKVLMSKDKSNCLCTAMLYDPKRKSEKRWNFLKKSRLYGRYMEIKKNRMLKKQNSKSAFSALKFLGL